MRFLVSRRSFLAAAAAARAMAAGHRMQLSLSVRVAESFENKEKSSMTIEQLIALAKSNGYAALCMRASQAGVQTPKPAVEEISGKIRAAGLRVSMVTGDFAVPKNDDHGPDGLRNITPYLGLAKTLGADLIRICMKKDEDINWAKKASQEAARRGIRLAHQSHCSSPFETVDGALRVLKAVNEPNFGLIYEPANWLISGEDYGAAAIRKLRPFIFNVYVQNHRLNPGGAAVVQTWKKGPVRLDHIGLWEKGGVDGEQVFGALRELGYRGYVTIHQAFEGVMSVEDAVRRSRNYLAPLVAE
jgi:sugar phosphate isomerase/epimerase